MLTIKLQPVSSGTSLVLNNVFFDHDKSELRKESFDELNKLTNFLNDHPLVRIELGGHTDSTGTEEHNIRLSLERAGSVKQYLINKGINPLRIKAVGYGSSVPIADNLQEEGRALNRRTELKLVD
jgi:outer membrane protein OmpA-like peptidoglycan-associated protein